MVYFSGVCVLGGSGTKEKAWVRYRGVGGRGGGGWWVVVGRAVILVVCDVTVPEESARQSGSRYFLVKNEAKVDAAGGQESTPSGGYMGEYVLFRQTQ